MDTKDWYKDFCIKFVDRLHLTENDDSAYSKCGIQVDGEWLRIRMFIENLLLLKGREVQISILGKQEKAWEFGDIYTNGINFWMVIDGSAGNEVLRTIAFSEDGKSVHRIVGHYAGTLATIKPYAKYYGNIHRMPSPSFEARCADADLFPSHRCSALHCNYCGKCPDST